MAELHVIGSLEGGTDFASANLFCKFKIETGSAWRLLEGTTEGQTHVDFPADGEVAVWSHPVDVHFAAKSIQGWPQLQVEVWRQDSFGRSDMVGYGFAQVPAAPGVHELDIPTWRPAGSVLEEMTAYFLGGTPQLRNVDLVKSTRDRFRLRTVSSGIVHVSLGIILKDFERHGVHTVA